MKSTANKKDSSSITHASNNYLNDNLSGNFSFQSYEQSPHFSPYVIQREPIGKKVNINTNTNTDNANSISDVTAGADSDSTQVTETNSENIDEKITEDEEKKSDSDELTKEGESKTDSEEDENTEESEENKKKPKKADEGKLAAKKSDVNSKNQEGNTKGYDKKTQSKKNKQTTGTTDKKATGKTKESEKFNIAQTSNFSNPDAKPVHTGNNFLQERAAQFNQNAKAAKQSVINKLSQSQTKISQFGETIYRQLNSGFLSKVNEVELLFQAKEAVLDAERANCLGILQQQNLNQKEQLHQSYFTHNENLTSVYLKHKELLTNNEQQKNTEITSYSAEKTQVLAQFTQEKVQYVSNVGEAKIQNYSNDNNAADIASAIRKMVAQASKGVMNVGVKTKQSIQSDSSSIKEKVKEATAKTASNLENSYSKAQETLREFYEEALQKSDENYDVSKEQVNNYFDSIKQELPTLKNNLISSLSRIHETAKAILTSELARVHQLIEQGGQQQLDALQADIQNHMDMSATLEDAEQESISTYFEEATTSVYQNGQQYQNNLDRSTNIVSSKLSIISEKTETGSKKLLNFATSTLEQTVKAAKEQSTAVQQKLQETYAKLNSSYNEQSKQTINDFKENQSEAVDKTKAEIEKLVAAGKKEIDRKVKSCKQRQAEQVRGLGKSIDKTARGLMDDSILGAIKRFVLNEVMKMTSFLQGIWNAVLQEIEGLKFYLTVAIVVIIAIVIILLIVWASFGLAVAFAVAAFIVKLIQIAILIYAIYGLIKGVIDLASKMYRVLTDETLSIFDKNELLGEITGEIILMLVPGKKVEIIGTKGKLPDSPSKSELLGPDGKPFNTPLESVDILGPDGKPFNKPPEPIRILGPDGKPVGGDSPNTPTILEPNGKPIGENSKPSKLLGPDGKPIGESPPNTPVILGPDGKPAKRDISDKSSNKSSARAERRDAEKAKAISDIPRKIIEKDENYYEPLRKITDGSDIARISELIGIDKEKVAIAKEHFMLDEHIYFDGDTGELRRGRFVPFKEDADNWMEVATKENPTSAAIKQIKELIIHEYREAEILRGNKKVLFEAFNPKEKNQPKLEELLKKALIKDGKHPKDYKDPTTGELIALAGTKLDSDYIDGMIKRRRNHGILTPYRYAHILANFTGGANPQH